MKIRTLYILLFVGLLLSNFQAKTQTKSDSKKPNVLLIMCDDLNDYQGIFGGHPQAKTPNIDKLAKSGTQFANAHTNVPLCSPSRNSLFTGIYPHNSKDFGWTPHFKNPLLKNAKTFVEFFTENGYKTMGSGKLLHKDVKKIWAEWGVPRRINYGPHASNGKKLVGNPFVKEPFRSINFVDGSFGPLSNIPTFPANEIGDKHVGWSFGKEAYRYVNDNDRDLLPDERHAVWAANKLKEMEKNNFDEPFFMGVGFVKPHTPLYAPKKYFDMFPLDQIQLPKIKEGDLIDTYYKSVYDDSEMGLHYYKALYEAYPDNDEGLKLFVQAYLACVAFVDDQVGVVMDALNNSKFKENTIVIFTSDHGWQMGEKEYLYKNSLWEESTRIPFIIRHPELSKPGSVVNRPVSLIDIYPTLVDLCNLEGNTNRNEKTSQLDGFSLKPFLTDLDNTKWKGPEGALTMTGVGINHPIEGLAVGTNPQALWHIQVLKELPDSFILKQNYAYRTKNFRYIRYHNGKEELYDHRTDPYEWNNVAENKKYKSTTKKLRKKVEFFLNRKK